MSATASSLAELFPNSTSADNGQSSLMFDPRKPGAVNPFATDANNEASSKKAVAAADDDLASLAAGAGSNFGSIPLDAALATLIRKRVLSDSQMMDFSVSESIKALVFHMLMGSTTSSENNNNTSKNQQQQDVVVPLVAAALADRCCPAVEANGNSGSSEVALDAYSSDVMAYFAVHMMTLDDPKITKEWIHQLKVLWTVGLSTSSSSWPAQVGMTRGGPVHLQAVHMQHQLGACVLLTSFVNLLPSLVNFVPNAAVLGIASLTRALLGETVPLLVKIAKGDDTTTPSSGNNGDTTGPKAQQLTVLQLAAMEACLACLKKLHSTAAEALSEEARSTFNLAGPGEGFNRLFSVHNTWEELRAQEGGIHQHPLDDVLVWNTASWISPIVEVAKAFLLNTPPSSSSSTTTTTSEAEGEQLQRRKRLVAMMSVVESKGGGLVLVDTLNEERAMLISRHRSEVAGSDQYHHTDALLCALTQRVAISAVHIATGVLSAMETTLDNLQIASDNDESDEDSEKPQQQNGTAFIKAVQAANTCSQDALLLLADAQLLTVSNVKTMGSSMGSTRSLLNGNFIVQLQERLEHGFTPSQGHAHVRRTTAGTGILVYLLQHIILLSQFITISSSNSHRNNNSGGTYNWLLLESFVLQRGDSDNKCGALFPSRAVSALTECVLAVLAQDGEIRGHTCAFAIPPPEASTFISSIITMISKSSTCPQSLLTQQIGDKQESAHPSLLVIAQAIAALVHSPHTNHLTTGTLATIITQSFSFTDDDTTTYNNLKTDAGGRARIKLLLSQVLNILAQKATLGSGDGEGDNCTTAASFKHFKEVVLDTPDASSWNALIVAMYKNMISLSSFTQLLEALSANPTVTTATKKSLFGALSVTAISVISPQQQPTSTQLDIIVESTQILEALFSVNTTTEAYALKDESTIESLSATWNVLSTAWDLLFTSDDENDGESPQKRSHNKYAFRTPGDVALSFIPPPTTADVLSSTSNPSTLAVISPQSSTMLDLLTRFATTATTSCVPFTSATAKWVVQKAMSCVTTVPNTTMDNNISSTNKPVGMALWIPICNGLQRRLVTDIEEEEESSNTTGLTATTFLRALCIEIGIAVEKQWSSPKCDESDAETWNLGMCAPLLCIRNIPLTAFSKCHIAHDESKELMITSTLPRLLLQIALSKWAHQDDSSRNPNNNRVAVSADVRKLCGETLSRFPLSLWVEGSGWMGELTDTVSSMGLQPSEQQLPLVEKVLSLCFVLCSHLSTVASSSQSSVCSYVGEGSNLANIATLLTPLLEALSRSAQQQHSTPPHVLLQHLLFAVRDSMCFILLVRFNSHQEQTVNINASNEWKIVDDSDAVNTNFIYFLQTRLATIEKQHKGGISGSEDSEKAASSLRSITTILGRWASAAISGEVEGVQSNNNNIGTALLAALDTNPPTYRKLPLYVGCLVFIAKLKVLRVELGAVVDTTDDSIPSVLAPFLRTSSTSNSSPSQSALLQRLAERTNSLEEIEEGAAGGGGPQVKLLGQLCVLIDALSEP